MPVRNLTHGTLVIKDGAGTPASLTVPIQKGDLKFSEKREAHVIKNRGVLKEYARGEEMAVEMSFSIVFERWSQKTGGAATVVDALKNRGGAASWTTTSANKQNAPFTTKLEFTIADVEGTGGGYNEMLAFNHFHPNSIEFSEGEDADSIEISGTALVTNPTVTATAT